MNPRFIASLPKEAQGKDFRVIADEGGYADIVNNLGHELGQSYQTSFEISAQRDYQEIMLRVTVNRNNFVPNGAELRFDGAVGEFLNFDGEPTGNFCEVLLGIDPSISQSGQTVGVLRMKPISGVLPEAI